MLQKINLLFERVDRLSLRERALVFLTVLFVLGSAWQGLLMGPLDKRETRLSRELDETSSRIAMLQESESAAGAGLADLPGRELTRRAERVDQALNTADEAIVKLTSELIPPPQMPVVLEEVLARQDGLRLVRMENLTPRPLVLDDEQDEEQTPEDTGLFRHSLQIEFEGRYMDCLDYLRDLEELPWRFNWQAFDLETINYPLQRIVIEVQTLSLDEEWIGV